MNQEKRISETATMAKIVVDNYDTIEIFNERFQSLFNVKLQQHLVLSFLTVLFDVVSGFFQKSFNIDHRSIREILSESKRSYHHIKDFFKLEIFIEHSWLHSCTINGRLKHRNLA